MIDSIALVVRLTLRISTSYSTKDTNSAQAFSQSRMIAGLRWPPPLGELVEPLAGRRVGRWGLIGIERLYDPVPVLTSRVTEAVAEQVNDALLDHRLGQVELIVSGNP